jgi:hypothetical protein
LQWTIRRPVFLGLNFNLTSLELEEHANCSYDFLAISTREVRADELDTLLPTFQVYFF